MPRTSIDPAAALPFVTVADGVRVRVRVTTRSRANRVVGIVDDGDGRPALSVHVTAAPHDGEANRALVRVLAATWRLPASALRIVGGAAGRRKAVLIDGDPARVLAHVTASATPSSSEAGGRR